MDPKTEQEIVSLSHRIECAANHGYRAVCITDTIELNKILAREGVEQLPVPYAVLPGADLDEALSLELARHAETDALQREIHRVMSRTYPD